MYLVINKSRISILLKYTDIKKRHEKYNKENLDEINRLIIKNAYDTYIMILRSFGLLSIQKIEQT